jgi:hypothetical protein
VVRMITNEEEQIKLMYKAVLSSLLLSIGFMYLEEELS